MPSIRDRVVAALDIRRYYESEGLDILDEGDHYRSLCVFHSEDTASLVIRKTDGVFNCFGCGSSGSVFDFAIRHNGYQGTPAEQFKEAMTSLADFAKIDIPDVQPLPDEATIKSWQVRLEGDAKILKWMEKKRALSIGTLREWGVGWDGERLTIPIRDASGTLLNIRRYLPNGRDSKFKMVGIAGHNGRVLWPSPIPGGEGSIILCEGEMDRLVLAQRLYRGLTVTSGAGNWRAEWNGLFNGLDVVIAYDADEAGERGAARVGRYLLTTARSVRILRWPEGVKKGYDVTDFFLDHTNPDFDALLAAAEPFVPALEVAVEKNGHYPFTDHGNAHRFVDSQGQDIVYITELKKFYVWTDRALARG